MNKLTAQSDANFWRNFVIDAEFQAEITDDDEAAQVFASFLFYWLERSTVSKVILYKFPSFKDYEFLITPDEEFYVSSLLGEVIEEIVTTAKNRLHQQTPATDFVITNN